MEFNRFDIVEAHYWFCIHYHSGQGSDLYARQCKISRYFKPGASSDGPSSENACEIYNNLERRHGHAPTPYVVLDSGEARLSDCE
jgi:hypothetical protein